MNRTHKPYSELTSHDGLIVRGPLYAASPRDREIWLITDGRTGRHVAAYPDGPGMDALRALERYRAEQAAREEEIIPSFD